MVAVSSASALASADVAGKAVVVAGTDGLSEVREMANAGVLPPSSWLAKTSAHCAAA